jgi:hypothetical protein
VADVEVPATAVIDACEGAFIRAGRIFPRDGHGHQHGGDECEARAWERFTRIDSLE